MHICMVNWFLSKGKRQFNEELNSAGKNGAGTNDAKTIRHLYKRNKKSWSTPHIIVNNSKWISDLNVKLKTIKL